MGTFQGGNFQAIQEYFQHKYCRFCNHPFTSEGIHLLREEPGILVVKIICCSCSHPLGVAIVGVGTRAKESRQYPLEWTKKDQERLNHKPPISYDDVLEAHQFLSNLGSDWSQHLPKVGR